MSLDRLTSLIKAGSMEATPVALQLGPAAVPTLVRLSGDAAPGARLAALVCLEAVGGDQVAPTALAHIEDADEQTAAQAIMMLHRFPPRGAEKTLLAAFDRGRYPVSKTQIPLVVGRIVPTVERDPWKKRHATAGDSGSREALLAALARMGDTEARSEFSRQLQAARGPDVIRWLEFARYMEDRWVLAAIVPLLDRREVALHLAPDMPNTLPQRVGDLAAKAALEIAKVEVPFPAKRVTPFTDEELATIRRAVSAPPSTAR